MQRTTLPLDERQNCQPNAPLATSPGAPLVRSTLYRFKRKPAQVICHHCQNTIETFTKHKAGALAWISVVTSAFLVVGWVGLCLVPLHVKKLKDKVHYCPCCKKEVGRYCKLNAMFR